MSQTEPKRWEQLAGALFDEVVVPLAAARIESLVPTHFPLGPEEAADTYFVSLGQPTTAISPYRGGDADDLVDTVTSLWAEEGHAELVDLGERMKEIAQALADEPAISDGTVDVLCYTLF